MKIDKQLPITTVLDPKTRPRTPVPEMPAARRGSNDAKPADTQQKSQFLTKGSGFNLQLNQQLSSMQLAERYLGDLNKQLQASKLSISRQLSSSEAVGEKEKIAESLRDVNKLLQARGKRSGGAIDASLKLRFNEPLRSRFSMKGLDSIEAIQRSGKETLLFSASPALSEPMAVVLNDDMSQEQILRRFNNSLAPAGMRAELDENGALKFSAPEETWQDVKTQLRVQGEGKLFDKGTPKPVSVFEDGLQGFSTNVEDSPRELRQLLDSVVAALDKIAALRDQISQRQADVREFLARQESRDEQKWALNFAGGVFKLQGRTSSSYEVVSQTVIAQANLTRFAVVSLLS